MRFYLSNKTYKMDNRGKTYLFILMLKKYITHKDKQYNTHATHSYNIVTFICDIIFLFMLFRKLSYFMHTDQHANLSAPVAWWVIQLTINTDDVGSNQGRGR